METNYVAQRIMFKRRVLLEQVLEVKYASTTSSAAAALLREAEAFLDKHIKVHQQTVSKEYVEQTKQKTRRPRRP